MQQKTKNSVQQYTDQVMCFIKYDDVIVQLNAVCLSRLQHDEMQIMNITTKSPHYCWKSPSYRV